MYKLDKNLCEKRHCSGAQMPLFVLPRSQSAYLSGRNSFENITKYDISNLLESHFYFLQTKGSKAETYRKVWISKGKIPKDFHMTFCPIISISIQDS